MPEEGDDRLAEALQRAQGLDTDRKRYASLGLLRNPFPFASISSPEEVAFLPLLTEAEKSAVAQFLAAPRPALLWISGEYGMGKTHILLWLRQYINDMGGGLLSAYYVPNPGRSLEELVQQFMHAIGKEDLGHKIRQLVIRRFHEDIKQRGKLAVLSEIRLGQAILQSEEESNLVSRLLEEERAINDVAWLEIARILFPKWEGVVTYAGHALTRLGLGPSQVCDELAAFAFQGEAMDAHAWTALLGTRKRAPVTWEDYMKALITVLTSTGFRRVFLLIDEMEDLLVTVRLTPRQKSDYLASIRLLLDETLAELGVVMAGVPAAWARLQELYAAMKGRSTVHLEIERLDRTTGSLLVKGYLKLAKEAPDDSVGPFTSDAIPAALKAAEGNRRLFIAICYQAVEHAASRGKSQVGPADVQAGSEGLPA